MGRYLIAGMPHGTDRASIWICEHKDDELNIEKLLPEGWNGKYTSHLLDLSKFEGEDTAGLTHLALYQAAGVDTEGLLMFGADPIQRPFFILGYKDGKPEYLHCDECCILWTEFILSWQEDWSASSNIVPLSQTRH